MFQFFRLQKTLSGIRVHFHQLQVCLLQVSIRQSNQFGQDGRRNSRDSRYGKVPGH